MYVSIVFFFINSDKSWFFFINVEGDFFKRVKNVGDCKEDKEN